jgi:hypothetical protein
MKQLVHLRNLHRPYNLLGYRNARKAYLMFHLKHEHASNVCSDTVPTIEHIVPQSLVKGSKVPIRNDIHNFLVYPDKLNTLKSSYKYVSDMTGSFKCISEDGSRVSCDAPPESGSECREFFHIINSKQKQVLPAPQYRGVIARSIAYMCLIYPEYSSIILNHVLDIQTLYHWHLKYPVSKFEYDRSLFVSFLQGNHNPFVLYPNLLHNGDDLFESE